MGISFRSLLRDERGTTAIEYGLITLLIVSVLIGALINIGGSVLAMMQNAAADL